jgi:hypothetical protein
MPTVTEQPSEPPVAVVEWGTETPRLTSLRRMRWWHPAIPAVLAGLGSLALFGSLVGEWQVVTEQFDESFLADESAQTTSGIGQTLVWGPAWLVGATLLASCVGLALFGPSPMRRYTRAVGLALAGALLIVLVGAVQDLRQEYLYYAGVEGLEVSVGRGVYAAFGTVALFGLALGLAGIGARTEPAPVPAQRSGPPPDSDGPDDLTVGPAEPLTELSDDHRLGR